MLSRVTSHADVTNPLPCTASPQARKMCFTQVIYSSPKVDIAPKKTLWANDTIRRLSRTLDEGVLQLCVWSGMEDDVKCERGRVHASIVVGMLAIKT